MCKLLIGIKLKDKDEENNFEKVLKLQENILRKEPHGVASLKILKNDSVIVKKALDDYSPVFDDIYKSLGSIKVVGLHTRQATSGNIDLKNTHFFEVGDYLFAHNGFVNEYSLSSSYGYNYYPNNRQGKIFIKKSFGTLTEFHNPDTEDLDSDYPIKEKSKSDMCDSYQFLKNIKKPITKSIIESEAFEKGFTGVGVIVDKRRKRIFIFSTRKIQVHTDFENYIFLYSFQPKDKIKEYKSFLGLPLYEKDNEEVLTSYEIDEGVYEMRYDNKNLKLK